MKHMIKGALFLLLLMSFEMNAQTGNTDFTLHSELVQVNGYDTAISSSIKRTGNVIRWTQHAADQDHHLDFVISDSSGDWDITTDIGMVTYDLMVNGLPFSLSLTGQTTGISATLTQPSNTQATQYIFIIDSITRS